MRKIILNFNRQFPIGIKLAKKVKIPGQFEALTLGGVGGSALVGDLLKIWLESYKIALPVFLHRDYGLPYQTDQSHLVVLISYSGNTEETLFSFEQAKRKDFSLCCITSGGRLYQLCKKNKIPVVKIPSGLPPRMSIGYQFSALMQILVNCGMIRNNLKNLLNLEKNLKPKKLEKEGKRLAKKLLNKIPLIYASRQREAIARIWKIKFNENSKVPAFWNFFPELNHNELVGLERFKDYFLVLILKDPADHPRNLKRMELTAKILKERGVGVEILNFEGKDILYKIFSSLLLADWTSFYLAKNYKIDPLPVKIVEEFKKRLGK
jgi:glucose/mannose-6-phosphate isomerase